MICLFLESSLCFELVAMCRGDPSALEMFRREELPDNSESGQERNVTS